VQLSRPGHFHSKNNEKLDFFESSEEAEDRMLSRVAFRAGPALSPNAIVVRTGATATTPAAVEPKWKSPMDGPERDYVNWPRRQRPIEKPPVRLKMFPEEWFTALHSKTGATGPYMFLAGFGTYLVSKEIYVLEHEFYCGVALFAAWAFIVKQVGPEFTKNNRAEMDKLEAEMAAVRQDEIDRCLAAIKDEEQSQFMKSSYEELIAAKKENVALQLESAYRSRINEAYQQVKKRLDYQLELANMMRRMEQKHMADWIMSNVRKSITAKQEDDALKKCIADLKTMAK